MRTGSITRTDDHTTNWQYHHFMHIDTQCLGKGQSMEEQSFSVEGKGWEKRTQAAEEQGLPVSALDVVKIKPKRVGGR